jgi:hypothetical protein
MPVLADVRLRCVPAVAPAGLRRLRDAAAASIAAASSGSGASAAAGMATPDALTAVGVSPRAKPCRGWYADAGAAGAGGGDDRRRPVLIGPLCWIAGIGPV